MKHIVIGDSMYKLKDKIHANIKKDYEKNKKKMDSSNALLIYLQTIKKYGDNRNYVEVYDYLSDIERNCE